MCPSWPARAVGFRLAGGLVVLLALCPAATADVLVPAWFVVIESALGLHFVPAILFVETIIAKRILGISLLRTIAVVVVANTAVRVGAVVAAPAPHPLTPAAFAAGDDTWMPRPSESC